MVPYTTNPHRRVIHHYFGWSDPLDIGPYKSWVCGMIVHDYHGKGLFGGSYHSETASSNHHRPVVGCPNYPTAPISLWFLVSSQLFFRVISKAWPVPDQSRITNPDRGKSPATGAICSAGMISPFAQIHFIYNIMQHILLFSAMALLLIPAYNQFVTCLTRNLQTPLTSLACIQRSRSAQFPPRQGRSRQSLVALNKRGRCLKVMLAVM